MTPLRVLDVSRWQGCIDWDAVQRSGAIDGVMLRVLGSRNGQPYPDPQFERNHAACTMRGIPVGGYYYTCAVTSRQTEAELNALQAALRGKTFQLPLAIDVEDARLRSLSPAALAQRVAQAAAQLEAWNLYAMVYTYTNFADTALAMDALTAYDLWLADYRGKRPTRPHGVWQYTSTGHVAGIDGPVDLSRAYKDYPALCRRAGLGRFSGCAPHITRNARSSYRAPDLALDHCPHRRAGAGPDQPDPQHHRPRGAAHRVGPAGAAGLHRPDRGRRPRQLVEEQFVHPGGHRSR